MPRALKAAFMASAELLVVKVVNQVSQNHSRLYPELVDDGIAVRTLQMSENGLCRLAPLVMFQSTLATASMFVLPFVLARAELILTEPVG